MKSSEKLWGTGSASSVVEHLTFDIPPDRYPVRMLLTKTDPCHVGRGRQHRFSQAIQGKFFRFIRTPPPVPAWRRREAECWQCAPLVLTRSCDAPSTDQRPDEATANGQ